MTFFKCQLRNVQHPFPSLVLAAGSGGRKGLRVGTLSFAMKRQLPALVSWGCWWLCSPPPCVSPGERGVTLLPVFLPSSSRRGGGAGCSCAVKCWSVTLCWHGVYIGSNDSIHPTAGSQRGRGANSEPIFSLPLKITC